MLVTLSQVIRAQYLLGHLDGTAAGQAVADLRDWPGECFEHRWLLDRVWRLRDSVRGWDAFYVALAEAFDATLLTLDGRLANAHDLACRIERTPARQTFWGRVSRVRRGCRGRR